jgi:hypothetical protein
MSDSGKRWSVKDRDGNSIYLTEERWRHIVDGENHPEMETYEEHLKITLQKGKREQEPLNPRKFRYIHFFDNLADDFNSLVAIVLFGFSVNKQGKTEANNFVTTAFLKYVRQAFGKKEK